MTISRKIIIDTDPGQDDAVAILTALASPDELEVLAVTAVAGNVPLDLTTTNALMLVELADRADVPVYAGCARPMVNPLVTAEYVHGPTGLDGANLPAPSLAVGGRHAVDVIVDSLRSAGDREVTLCILGPMTNVALAMIKAPDILPKICEIVFMGGGFFEGGNVTPAAEFNIYVDPHAAHVVLSSGVPLTMMPLDVTHKALATAPRVEAFAALGTPAGDAVAGMLGFFDRYDMEKYGSAGAPLHDPCVIAYLLEPDLFAGRECHVAVVTDSGPPMGMTLVDWWGVTDQEPTVMVMNDVDADGFFSLLTERIGRL
ncbi:MAG: nucleoside hydrolase [Acidimicrobiia bacterium]